MAGQVVVTIGEVVINNRVPAGDTPAADEGVSTPKVSFWGDAFAEKPAPYDPAQLPVQQGVDCNWELSPDKRNPWELVTILGITLTGLCTLSARRVHRMDKKKTPGGDGATPTLLGIDPFAVDLSVKMWTANHFRQYRELVDRIENVLASSRDAGAGSFDASKLAFDVVHPALALLKVRQLYIEDFTLPKPTATLGVFESIFRLTEHRPIPKATKTQTVNGSFESVGVHPDLDVNKVIPPSTSSAKNP